METGHAYGKGSLEDEDTDFSLDEEILLEMLEMLGEWEDTELDQQEWEGAVSLFESLSSRSFPYRISLLAKIACEQRIKSLSPLP